MSVNGAESLDGSNLRIYSHTRYADIGVSATERLVQDCQEIGYQAWSAQLERQPDEIDHVYGSQKSREALRTTLWSLRAAGALHESRFGRRLDGLLAHGAGALLVAKLTGDTPDEQRSVGYAIVRNDVSGGLLRRIEKARAGRLPYAWLQSINVRPEYQGQGVGSALLHAAFEQFKPEQRPTAYVLDENQRGLAYFQGIGFQKQPLDQEPGMYEGYFGPNTDPVRLWRLEAESCEMVQHAVAARAPTTRAVPAAWEKVFGT